MKKAVHVRFLTYLDVIKGLPIINAKISELYVKIITLDGRHANEALEESRKK